MNKEDIIRMAREADNINCDCCLPDPDEEFMEDFLVAFAALVAAAEREACARECENVVSNEGYVQSKWCVDAIRARGQEC